MIFIQVIKMCIKWFIPYGIILLRRKKLQELQKLEKALSEQQYQEKGTEIKKYFLSLNKDDIDDNEILEIIDYFMKYKFSIFPYSFSRKYHVMDIGVFYDKTNKTHYVLHENKRLYYPDDWESENIRTHYNGLCIEQDKDSPHRYETDEFTVKSGDIIVDVGVAEGIWALSYAEKAGKIYLFECDKKWIKALRKTFEPWKEKVVIVDKYVSDTSDKKNISLDDFFNKERIDFIKADIEGMEIKLLEGSKEILARNSNLTLLLCAYHSANDATEIKKYLELNNFYTEYSKRYMLIINDEVLEKPYSKYIRRGLVRAKKNNSEWTKV